MSALGRHVYVLLAGLIFAAALLTLSSYAWAQPVANEIDEDPEGVPYAAGELLVVYKEDAPESEVESVEQEAAAEVEEEIPEIDTQLLELPEIKDEQAEAVRERELEQLKEDIEEDPVVESVDYNYVYTGTFTPRDPKFKLQWGLKKTGFEKAWNRSRGKGVKVAVVDSGTAIRHVDLRRKVAAKYDFVNRNGTVEDLHGHGTHVAGIAVAKSGNKRGIVGGSPASRLIVAKALNKDLIGYNSNIADAIVWSANKGARVINLSLGSQGRSSTMEKAINYATNKGALVVAAGGNYGDNKPVYPAAYGKALGVIHTDSRNRRGFDASRGKHIGVAAPGVDVVSTVPGGYSYKSGSSMATPHAAALAGLMAQKMESPKSIRRRMSRTAQDLGPRGRDPYYGNGLIRADRAVRR